MPELPELQAHAERLAGEFSGLVLGGFRAITFTALKTWSPPPEQALGEPLAGVTRIGKYLVMDFGGTLFVVHLMQGGRLKPDEKQSPKPRGGLARWTFADGSALLLSEAGTEKRAGVWVVDPGKGDITAQDPLAGLGPDADRLDAGAWGEICRAHPGRLHGLLRRQQAVAGIGRRLANEICHRARLSPFANASRLDAEQIQRLTDATTACVADSLSYERGRTDMSSSKERPGSVHHRAGEPCPVCGDVVREVGYTRYSVDYCATCQTGGKVLADNTTSRFLK